MSWIDGSVVLDFKLPDDIQSVADECERLDECRDYGYFNWAEALSDMCKEAVVQKHMTEEQWDLVERKYIYGKWNEDC